ncbi:MAG: hypothetical protein JNJ57_12995 [Saprospiraceae bacterium]|nr:hypothetical protein [Saprospiraceae bacterium]
MKKETAQPEETTFNVSAINYEDEGFQLGLNGRKTEKDERLNRFKEQQQALTLKHESLRKETEQTIREFSAEAIRLVNDLLAKLDEFDDRKTNALRDLLIGEFGLHYYLKSAKEADQTRIQTLIQEFGKEIDASKEVVRKSREKVAEQVDPALLQQQLTNHYQQLEIAAKEVMDTFLQIEQFEKGYSYGDSIRQLLETKKRS